MIRRSFFILASVFFGVFLTVERSAAFEERPSSGGTGVVTGDMRAFTHEAFVLANKNDGANFSTCGLDDNLLPIEDMTVTFETKTSGLVEILFCGNVVNDDGSNDVDVVAMIDPPSNYICQPGNIRWEEGGGDDNGGASCFTWICEVENEKTCGWYGHAWCKTEHSIQMQCSTTSDEFDSHFNSRILKAFYNKGERFFFGDDDDD